MRTLVLSLVLLVTAAPSPPGNPESEGVRRRRAVLADRHPRRHGRHCLGRLQGGGPRRSRHALVGLAPLDTGGGSPIAVIAGLGAVWSLDSGGVVSRLDLKSGQVTAKIETGAAGPYNLWIGDGSLWSVDDRAGTVLRIDPARRKVVARIPVGDGPADMVFRGKRAWVINHRDLGLVAIDTATNRPRKLGNVPGDAPERLAWAAGSLWVTGRGTDLLRLDPETGAVKATIEIGAGGIDVVANGGSLWVPARAAAADRARLPDDGGAPARRRRHGEGDDSVRARSRIDVHGLLPYRGGVLFADNTGGRLYTVPG